MHETNHKHEGCGETLVCPRCHPVMEQTNCINVRFKGPYNGGLPNHLVIFPSFCRDNKPVSVAILVGDNFHAKGHYYSHSKSVKKMAQWIVDMRWHDAIDYFKLEKYHQPMFADLQDNLALHLKEIIAPHPTSETEISDSDESYLVFMNFESGMRGFETFSDKDEANSRLKELQKFYAALTNSGGIEIGVATVGTVSKHNWKD
jgi:hypothetical protein